MNLFRSILVLTAIVLTGCATEQMVADTYDRPGMPGHISESVSDFDGTRSISLVPAYTESATRYIYLGASWSPSLPNDVVILIVEIARAENFEPEKPLEVRAGTDYFSLEPVDSEQYGRTTRQSMDTSGIRTYKGFKASWDQFSAIVESDDVVLRFHLLDSIVETTVKELVDNDQRLSFISAKQALRRFRSKVTSSVEK